MMRRVFLAFALALGLAASGWAQGANFSTGLTGLGGSAPAASANAEMQAKQAQAAAIEAQAATVAQSGGRLVATGATEDTIGGYRLGAGDKVRITVFGEDDLTGEFEVDSTGSIAMPLVGEVPAGGKTPRELERALTNMLDKGYLVNPRVNVEVLNFRPFFILGEVNKPGSYPYVNDMTVISAVALAGGYTTRAKTGQVLIKHASDPSKQEVPAAEDARVGPGDVIRVEERFF